MAEDSIVVVNNEPFPDASPPAPVEEAPPQPPPWEQKLAALERLTQQLQVDNARLTATVETTQRLRPPEPEPVPEPQGPPPRPQTRDFEGDQAGYDAAMDTWLDARNTYTARQTLEEHERQRMRQAQEGALQAQEQERRQQIAEREQALRAAHPDYDTRWQQVAQQASPALYGGLQWAGAHGPDLLLYLHAHPEEMQRLNQLAPQDIPFALGQLLPQAAPPTPATEAAPVAGGGAPHPPATPVAQAPPARMPPPAPPQTVTAGGSVPTGGYRDDMPQADYEAWRKSTGRPFARN
jgi:hypothetical protein